MTGGARGIGQAAAIRAAREGANVAILDWLPKEGQATVDQIVAEGGKAIFIEGNVQKTEDCNRMVEETVKEFGELNYALNHAGVLDGVYSGDPFDFEAQRPLLPNSLHLATDEYFDAVLATNIYGVLLAAGGQVSAQAVPSGPSYGIGSFQRLVVALIHDARQRVVITTPYFIPDEPFIQALETAVMSGVEVILIVSSKVDQVVVGLAQSGYYEQLLAAGVKLYLYGQALLHAEERRYIDRSTTLTLETWRQRPDKDKFLQNIAKLVSPLL